MRYNFDQIINRQGTNSLKHDFAKERDMPEDVLPMWVADMDFPAPPEVLTDLQNAVTHGIFGYSETKEDYAQSISNWFRDRFAYEVKPAHIVKTPGVVFALAQMVRALTKQGDAVLIQPPVYQPFFDVVLENNRKLVTNPLVLENGKYTINFDDFQQKIAENKVKLFVLCNPHNPVGRVWTKDELEKLNKICKQYNVLVISDEIHCDFIYPGHIHTVFGSIDENAIVATAPSKTFNLAGLQMSNLLIKNQEIRQKIIREIRQGGYSQLNQLGLVACQSAYQHGAPWVDALRTYLAENIAFVREFLAKNIPDIQLIEPEGTYLLWLDCRKLNLPQDKLDDLLINHAKLWLCSGKIFGEEGHGFQRMNVGCPRSVLEEGMRRLAGAL